MRTNLFAILLLIALTACEHTDLVNPETKVTNRERQMKIFANGDTIITLQSGARVLKKGCEYIYQGDIVLTEEQVEMLDQPVTKSGFLTNWSKKWTDQTV